MGGQVPGIPWGSFPWERCRRFRRREGGPEALCSLAPNALFSRGSTGPVPHRFLPHQAQWSRGVRPTLGGLHMLIPAQTYGLCEATPRASRWVPVSISCPLEMFLQLIFLVWPRSQKHGNWSRASPLPLSASLLIPKPSNNSIHSSVEQGQPRSFEFKARLCWVGEGSKVPCWWAYSSKNKQMNKRCLSNS